MEQYALVKAIEKISENPHHHHHRIARGLGHTDGRLGRAVRRLRRARARIRTGTRAVLPDEDRFGVGRAVAVLLGHAYARSTDLGLALIITRASHAGIRGGVADRFRGGLAVVTGGALDA